MGVLTLSAAGAVETVTWRPGPGASWGRSQHHPPPPREDAGAHAGGTDVGVMPVTCSYASCHPRVRREVGWPMPRELFLQSSPPPPSWEGGRCFCESHPEAPAQKSASSRCCPVSSRSAISPESRASVSRPSARGDPQALHSKALCFLQLRNILGALSSYCNGAVTPCAPCVAEGPLIPAVRQPFPVSGLSGSHEESQEALRFASCRRACLPGQVEMGGHTDPGAALINTRICVFSSVAWNIFSTFASPDRQAAFIQFLFFNVSIRF